MTQHRVFHKIRQQEEVGVVQLFANIYKLEFFCFVYFGNTVFLYFGHLFLYFGHPLFVYFFYVCFHILQGKTGKR